MDSLGVCIGGMGAMFRPSKVRDTGVEFLVVGMRLEVYVEEGDEGEVGLRTPRKAQGRVFHVGSN